MSTESALWNMAIRHADAGGAGSAELMMVAIVLKLRVWLCSGVEGWRRQRELGMRYTIRATVAHLHNSTTLLNNLCSGVRHFN